MNNGSNRLLLIAGVFAGVVSAGLGSQPAHALAAQDVWDLAKEKAPTHRFSTLFTAQNVRDLLATDEGISRAIDWCRKTAVTKVYIESFREGYRAERGALLHAKQRFLAAGLEVSGCVTTTGVGKRSTGWRPISCYTDQATQEHLQRVFEYTAGMFDEIMIDDFWFTDCKCPECDAARRARTVKIGDHSYRVAGDRWGDYHCELMVRLSQDRLLAAAKRVNPKVRLIIKYPQWYDHFHERGYEVVRETADFDRIWVGTETRDYGDRQWGGTPQYEGYFIMRWLGGIGGPKCGGGWYDPYGTTQRTYLEQARQTVLAGARESMLFCYGSLQEGTGPENIAALRRNIPELLAVAEKARRRGIIGVAAYKPANSHPENEARVFDFVGMLGLPLVPCHEFPAEARAAFFSVHALKDPELPQKLAAFIAAGKPVLVTDGLAKRLSGKANLTASNVRILPVKGDPKSLLAMPQSELDAMRDAMLRPLGHSFRAPARVASYLFDDGSSVIENFQDEPVQVELDGAARTIPPRQWQCQWKSAASTAAAADAKSSWRLGTPIATYWAGPTMTDAVARQMAEGGFNLVWCREQDLDVARRHGLRAQLHDALLNPESLDNPQKRAKLDALIERVRRHPALYDYFIVDEPSAAAFPALGKLVAYLRVRDPAHLAYINLFPTYADNGQLGTKGDTVTAYREYLRRYIREVKPSLVSWDHYQFAVSGDSPDYFLNLAMIRRATLDAGVPFLNIVQACTWNPAGMRVPGPDEERFLVYTTLAYGGQGISYFVYYSPDMTGGIVSADGKPTPLYGAARSLNREFVAIAKELQPLRSLGVYHAGMSPPGSVPLTAKLPFRFDPPVASMAYHPPERVRGFLIGYFGAHDKPSRAVVVNLDYKTPAAVKLIGPGQLEVFDAKTGTWGAGGQRLELRLPPGGGKLVHVVGTSAGT